MPIIKITPKKSKNIFVEAIKQGVSGVIGVSAYSGAACTLTPWKSNGVSGVSASNSVVLS